LGEKEGGTSGGWGRKHEQIYKKDLKKYKGYLSAGKRVARSLSVETKVGGSLTEEEEGEDFNRTGGKHKASTLDLPKKED